MNDFGREVFAHAWGEFDEAIGECFLASGSSASRSERSVCGIEQVASAMMAASRASVLASPACRSAMRRMARAGI
jgi:hypothetical protein